MTGAKTQINLTLDPELQAALEARKNGYPNLSMVARAVLCEALGLPIPLSTAERDAARRELWALVTRIDRTTLDALLTIARQQEDE